MSTDRSRRPFHGFEEAAESVLDHPAAGDLAHRLLASLLQTVQRAERAEGEAAKLPPVELLPALALPA